MKIHKTSRRMFLQGAGGAALAIPFLPSLWGKEARAQSASIPKRYIAVWSDYDYGHGRHWYPTLQPLPQSLQKTGEAPVGYQSLRSLLGTRPALSKILGAGLTPHLGSLNLLRGLDFIEYFGHGFGHSFGNLASITSNTTLNSMTHVLTVDQVLGRNRRVNPSASEPFLLSNNTTGASYGLNASGEVVRMGSMATTAQEVYQALFRSGSVAETGQAATAHPRRDVLSHVLEDYRRVRNGAQLSGQDRVVLDNSMDKLAEVERNISAQTTVSNGCSYKDVPRTYGTAAYDSAVTYKNMADLLVAGMMCDLNRVFHFSGFLADDYYNKSSGLFHDGHTHRPLETVAGKLNHEYLSEIQAQLVTNFLVPLLNGMASATDAANGKSILYNSLVHFSIESGTVHSFSDVPTLLAGNAGGALTSGHMIDYSNRALFDGEFNVPAEGGWSGEPTSPNWVGYTHGLPVNRVFNTVLQAMGLTRSEYERTDINGWYRNRTDGAIGAQNNNIAEVGGYGLVGVANPVGESAWEMYGHHRYHDYNLHYFKDPLSFPAASAS
jgi:hypothetical protein